MRPFKSTSLVCRPASLRISFVAAPATNLSSLMAKACAYEKRSSNSNNVTIKVDGIGRSVLGSDFWSIDRK